MATKDVLTKPKQIRSCHNVIDLALKDNRVAERLLYLLAFLIVIVGAFVLIWGVVMGQWVAISAGTVATALFWPAMREARQIRWENILIRLLEEPLSRADSAKVAADLIQEIVHANLMGSNKQKATQDSVKAKEHI